MDHHKMDPRTDIPLIGDRSILSKSRDEDLMKKRSEKNEAFERVIQFPILIIIFFLTFNLTI
jgi:hypothetical protein